MAKQGRDKKITDYKPDLSDVVRLHRRVKMAAFSSNALSSVFKLGKAAWKCQ